MSIVENLKAAGFKPEASSDGEWKPYTGTYGVTWVTLRLEIDEKNGNARYIQSEWDIEEVLDGDPKKDSKYAAFSQRTYLDGDDVEKIAKKVQKLLNQAFTFGVDADMSSDEAMIESLKAVVGKPGFIRGWEWKTKEGKTLQSFVVQKPEVAEKKRGKDAVPF